MTATDESDIHTLCDRVRETGTDRLANI